ncbi:MAG: hypothetical protein KAJ51_09495 [Thermoplasmata archaeon]|nr:hypothetical protein [Thermoplasmata archaeon]
MKNRQNIYKTLKSQLDRKEKLRQQTFTRSRALVSRAGELIRKVHKGEDLDQIQKGVNALKQDVDKLRSSLKKHPDLYYSNTVEIAEQEFCEAYIVLSILNSKTLPEPSKLKTTYNAYVLGLADAIGEFRRCALNSLRTGNIDKAHEFLEIMEDLNDILIKLDYPSGLIAVRRKQDIARGVIEKTRSEIAVIGSNTELMKVIQEKNP